MEVRFGWGETIVKPQKLRLGEITRRILQVESGTPKLNHPPISIFT